MEAVQPPMTKPPLYVYEQPVMKPWNGMDPDSLPFWVWIVIAAGGVMVIIIIVLFIVTIVRMCRGYDCWCCCFKRYDAEAKQAFANRQETVDDSAWSDRRQGQPKSQVLYRYPDDAGSDFGRANEQYVPRAQRLSTQYLNEIDSPRPAATRWA